MSFQNPGASTTLSAFFAKLQAWLQSDGAKKWLGALSIGVIFLISFWLAVNPQMVRHFGRWGYVGAFFISLIASATIILPAPGIAIVIAMSAGLNPYVLGIAAGVGSALGELTGYAAGRSGRAFIPEEQRRQVERLQQLTEKYGALTLAVLAALPFPLFDFAGMVAGMLKMRVLAFLVGVSVGKSIKYIVLILLGVAPLHWLQHFFH
jgi:membrane protein YqaA with SNARE-associated domain